METSKNSKTIFNPISTTFLLVLLAVTMGYIISV